MECRVRDRWPNSIARGQPRVSCLDSFHRTQRAFPDAEGEVYPVWFGTNRKPALQGGLHRRAPRQHHPRPRRGLRSGGPPLRRNRQRLLETSAALRPARRPPATATCRAAGAGRLLRRHPTGHAGRTRQRRAAARAVFPARVQRDLRGRRHPRGADRLGSQGAGGHGVLQLALARQRHGLPCGRGDHRGERAGNHRFPGGFRRDCGAEKVHVIAHSMGNRGLLRALQRIAGTRRRAAR